MEKISLLLGFQFVMLGAPRGPNSSETEGLLCVLVPDSVLPSSGTRGEHLQS